MRVGNISTGTLTWFQEGGFYWLDGELTNQLQSYPVKKMDWDDGITDHSGAPEKLVFGDITFTKLYEDDNVYTVTGITHEGAFSLMDIDGTGYYTGFMGSPLNAAAVSVTIVNDDGISETKTFSFSTSPVYVARLTCGPTGSKIRARAIAYATTSSSVTSTDVNFDMEGQKAVISVSDLLGVWSTYIADVGDAEGRCGVAIDPTATSDTTITPTFRVTANPPKFIFQRLIGVGNVGVVSDQ